MHETHSPAVHVVYLTSYWSCLSNPDDRGQEVLRISLSRPLTEVVTQCRLENGEHLRGFHLVFDDHLEQSRDSYSQEGAREELVHAANELRFMEDVGLVGVAFRTRERLPQIWSAPGIEIPTPHYSLREPGKGGVICLLRHPAEQAPIAVDGVAPGGDRRLFFATTSVARLTHVAEHAQTWFSDDADLLERVVARVNRLTNLNPIDPQAPWLEPALDYTAPYHSQLRLKCGRARRARRMPAPMGEERNGALPFRGFPGTGSEWRPAKRMAIEDHEFVFEHLHALDVWTGSITKRQPLWDAKRMLQSWFDEEYPHREGQDLGLLPGFWLLHRSRTPVDPIVDPAQRRRTIDELLVRLKASYGDCRPLRSLEAKLLRFKRGCTEPRPPGVRR